MRKTALFLIAFIPLLINAQDIQKLYDNNDFIQLSHLDIESLEPDAFSVSFIKANVHNAMARYEASNKEIDFLFTTSETKENLYALIEVLRLQADNFAQMFQYKQAAEIYKKLIDDYSNILEKNISSYQYKYLYYKSLSKTEATQIFIPHDTKIQTSRDKEDGLQIQVCTPKDSVSVIFDTGAGLSCVAKSVARKLGIRSLGDSLIVEGATGNSEYANIGVADTLYLGDILYTNVVFLIFEDAHLSWKNLDYSINGTLGFPEIKALSHIKLYKNGILEITKNEESHKSNMMFSRSQNIIVQVNDSLLLMLDTGGSLSNLSVNYYQNNKKIVTKTGSRITKIVNGVGSSKKILVYKLKEFSIKINASTIILPEINTFTRPTSEFWYEHDGTLGQDIISQYDYMLLDFNNMYFSLENEN